MGCRKSSFENIFLTDNLCHRQSLVVGFVARNIYINGKEAVISGKFTRQMFEKLFHFLPLVSLASLQK